MYTCELLNKILLLRPLPESGVMPFGKVCKMHWRVEIKNYTKLQIAYWNEAAKAFIFHSFCFFDVAHLSTIAYEIIPGLSHHSPAHFLTFMP